MLSHQSYIYIVIYYLNFQIYFYCDSKLLSLPFTFFNQSMCYNIFKNQRIFIRNTNNFQVTTSAPSTPKAAPIPKPQQKPQEDPETTQRIYAILGQYAEQLRNSPDLNNKPAPRRRSNPPTNPNQSSKRKKSGSGKSKSGQQTSEPSPSADDMGRTMGSSEDSSGGGNAAGSSSMMHMDSPAGFSADEAIISSNNNSQR